MSVFSVDRHGHRYFVDDRQIPSVTDIIKRSKAYANYDMVDSDIMKIAGARGDQVHDMAKRYWETGDLIFRREIEPYALALAEWTELSGFVPEYWEEALLDPDERFAGSYDVVGRMGKRWVLIDLKATATLLLDAVAMQTAAYQYLFEAAHPPVKIDRRYVLHLKKTGKPALIPLRGKMDLDRFMYHLNQEAA